MMSQGEREKGEDAFKEWIVILILQVSYRTIINLGWYFSAIVNFLQLQDRVTGYYGTIAQL